MNRKRIIIFAVLIAFQISAVAFLFIKTASIKNYATKNNTIVHIRCTAYDPFHPLKGRYAHLTLNKDDIKACEEQTGIELKNVQKVAGDYYLQEEYALTIDAMEREDFNTLNPVLELYVGKNGTVVQKALYVTFNGKELPIEQYIKDYAL